MDQINFIFINGRGSSGKDTQANKLVGENPQAVRISTGDIFRGASTPEGEFGRFYSQLEPYKESVNKGGFVPDEVMLPIVRTVIDDLRETGKNTFVFTGFPRTLGQLDATDIFLQSLRDTGIQVKADFLCYSVLERHAINRAEYRREQANLHGTLPRTDDDPDTVTRRLQAYTENTEPMLKRLAEEKRLHVIKSSGTIEEVEQRTKKALGISTTEIVGKHAEKR